ncbi:FAD-dependent oxidoreductase [Microbacterium sp. CGR2]|nr:FAD-dependent oxidoreductase [Microbacterium sp. CGR2]
MTSMAVRDRRRVVVVGAGVIGSATASRIAERGVDVVLLSAERAGSTATSRASFAWVNAHGKTPDAYRQLNEDSRRLHLRQSAVHDVPWFHRIGSEIDGVVHADDGYVDAEAFIAAQVHDLRLAGGTVRDAIPVESLDEVRGLCGPADAIVVAAGAGTAGLVAGIPRSARRLQTSTGPVGFLARIDVDEHPLPARVYSRDGVQVRPDGAGRVAAQSLRLEAELLRNGAVASRRTVWSRLRDEIERTLGWRIPADANVRIDAAPRPRAADGLPVVGWMAEDTYIALSHSGITLAPLLAESIARDLCGDEDPRLTPFRP